MSEQHVQTKVILSKQAMSFGRVEILSWAKVGNGRASRVSLLVGVLSLKDLKIGEYFRALVFFPVSDSFLSASFFLSPMPAEIKNHPLAVGAPGLLSKVPPRVFQPG